MAGYTKNFNLKLPSDIEFYDIEDFNENFEKIDQMAVKKGEGIGELTGGALSDRPEPGIAGRYYFAQDTGEIFLDTGEEWVLAAASQKEFDEHLAEIATQDGYGHIRLKDIPNPEVATKAEAEAGTNNTKMMTPLRVANAIDSKVRVIDNRVEININDQWLTFIYLPDDESGSPGNTKLIAGDWNAGYFGEVPGSELITGYDLANTIGLSKGYGQFGATGSWLKFAYQGKIQFIAKKPFRYNLSWEDIDNVNAVYGDKTIRINGLTYKVRLMRGANNDPAASKTGVAMHYSEWNRLMLPIHEQAINKNWPDSINVESDIPVWSHNYGTGQNGMYTNDDLHVNGGNGSRCWCQESFVDAPGHLLRGGTGITQSSSDVISSLYTGWRPVLELVE